MTLPLEYFFLFCFVKIPCIVVDNIAKQPLKIARSSDKVAKLAALYNILYLWHSGFCSHVDRELRVHTMDKVVHRVV